MNKQEINLFKSGYLAGYNQCCGIDGGDGSGNMWLLEAIWRYDNQCTDEYLLCPDCEEWLEWGWIGNDKTTGGWYCWSLTCITDNQDDQIKQPLRTNKG